jgi:nitroreductase
VFEAMTEHAQQAMTLEEALRERHSVRKYVTGHEIPASELNEILELAASAPSSWNLQHWKFLVITDQARKERLLPMAYNQQQTVDCSAVILVLGDLEADKNVRHVYDPLAESGAIPASVRDTMVQNVDNAYQNFGREFAAGEAALNAGFAAMQLMLAAKAKGYDTCPMGGIDRDALRKELNIPERYAVLMMITLGKAATPAHASTRLPLSETVVRETF